MPTNIKKYLSFFGLALLTCSLNAQPKNLRFEHLTTDEGLSQSTITCILEDYKGYMWFGTYDGLNRYDGNNFKVYHYNSKDSTSIWHDSITRMFEDKEKNLWIGTSDGLNLFDRERDNFVRFRSHINDSLASYSNFILAMVVDREGNVWLGSRGGGLNLLDKKANQIVNVKRQTSYGNSISTNFIYSLAEDQRGNIWIGGLYGDLDLYNIQEDKFINFKYKNRKIGKGIISSIIEDERGNIWVAALGNGIYKFSLSSDGNYDIENYKNDPNNSNSLSSDNVLSLITDYNQCFWIGTEHDGLNFFDNRTKTFTLYQKNTTKEKSLNHNSIWALYIDRKENLWVGTFAGGINFHSSIYEPFLHYKHYPGNANSLSNNSVSAFCEDSNGKIWIGTDGGGLNLFDPEKESFTNFNTKNSNLGSDAVLSLCEDSYGNFWVGTWAGGLNLFNRKTGKFIQYTSEKHGLGSNNISVIHEDRQGRLWIGAYWGGLSYFHRGKDRFVNYSSTNSGLPDDQIRVIKDDSFGNLWVCGESGLVKFNLDNQEFTKYVHDEDDPNSISNNIINTLFEASDSTLWIGTTYGLNKFRKETGDFARYQTEDGLPNNFIQGMMEDHIANLWISTNKGLSRFNPTTKIFKNFAISDGLQGNEFYRNSVYKTRNQKLYFGGQNGFNIFEPKSIFENPNIPQILITDFQIFNRPVAIGAKDSPLKKHISETTELTLSYKHSVFSFEFTALNYSYPEKNQYAYILEGFEEKWNYVGTKRTANYTSIAPGDYIFKVKGSNNDNKWNQVGTSIKIKIGPPFWKTWWAYLIYLALIIAAIYSVMYYILARQKLRSALEMEHLELEKMHELDQMKSRFFANVSHEFRTPITLILGPLKRLISNNTDAGVIQKPLLLIYRNAQRLLRMSNQLLDFHKIEAEGLKLELSKADIIQFIAGIVESFSEQANQHNIKFSFESNIGSKECWFDIDKIDKIVYNLLSNSFKFTKDNAEIAVRVSIKNKDTYDEDGVLQDNLGREFMEIVIKDNGIGIAPDKIEHIFKRFYQVTNPAPSQWYGTGIGLALTYELVQLYHGQITASSEEDKGSQFTVKLSLDRYFLEEHQLVGDFVSKRQFDHQVDYLKPEFDPLQLTLETDSLETAKALKSQGETILIIEDDKEMASYLKDAFDDEYRTILSMHGKEGYEKANELIPDIIISDIVMPELDGIQLCEKLKKSEKTSHIPIILITARTSAVQQIKGIETGADEYITKPFNLEVLQARVKNLLDSRKKLRERFSKDVTLNPQNVEMTSVDEQFMQKLINVVEENMAEADFNAEALSKKIGMSRMQLYRKLRSLTDQTVHEFIRNLRLKRALSLLGKKHLTVTEIAYQVGFNDLSYFARCFRKRYGKLASEFRMKRS